MKTSDCKIQLNFISSCAPAKSGHTSDTEQLLANLQECHDIDRPSEYKRWTGITPLRDRLVDRDVVVCCYWCPLPGQ